jgi:hypothetical protein
MRRVRNSFAKSAAIFTWRHAGVTLEQIAEEPDIVVTDFRADGLNRRDAVLEHFLCGRDSECLEVSARHAAGRCLETADEIARAHSCLPGENVDRNVAVEMLLQVFLALSDLLVGMRTRQLYD